MRFRHIYMIIGGTLVTLLWLLSDPDTGILNALPIGASTIAMLLILLKTVLYVAMLHVSRRALIDYIDFKIYFIKALDEPTGAGLAIVGISIIMLSIALLMIAAAQ